MKKLLTTLVLLIAPTFMLFAQVSFSCYYREYCTWNDFTESYSRCEGDKEASLFVMNDKETMFTHTTESIKSTYYINDKEYDESNETYIYFVTSDVGNKYIYVFDPGNKEVRILIEKNDEFVIVRFYVKAIF